MTSTTHRLALKVDCDTFEGTQKGIPNLLKLFEEMEIRASFFFTLGPDTSGRAIFRVFTQKGFLKKMLRSNAAALYGPKTMMYGTLLPSPMIGKRCGNELRSVMHAGHDTGVHAWDHIRWHDKLDRMSEQEIKSDYGRAHKAFADIFGKQARSSAAAGWHVSAPYLEIQDTYLLSYASNTRGGSPCYLQSDGKKFKTLEIPSTLPTWDEMLGDPTLKEERDFVDTFRRAIKGTEVHSIHTEVEGTAKLALFRRQLMAWKSDGVQFLTLDDLAKDVLQEPDRIPVRKLSRASIPNRGGLVSSSR